MLQLPVNIRRHIQGYVWPDCSLLLSVRNRRRDTVSFISSAGSARRVTPTEVRPPGCPHMKLTLRKLCRELASLLREVLHPVDDVVVFKAEGSSAHRDRGYLPPHLDEFKMTLRRGDPPAQGGPPALVLKVQLEEHDGRAADEHTVTATFDVATQQLTIKASSERATALLLSLFESLQVPNSRGAARFLRGSLHIDAAEEDDGRKAKLGLVASPKPVQLLGRQEN